MSPASSRVEIVRYEPRALLFPTLGSQPARAGRPAPGGIGHGRLHHRDRYPTVGGSYPADSGRGSRAAAGVMEPTTNPEPRVPPEFAELVSRMLRGGWTRVDVARVFCVPCAIVRRAERARTACEWRP